MSKKALLVVDVQQGFISSYTSRCLPRVEELLNDEKFDLVIATRFRNAENSPFRRQIKWDRLSSPEEIALYEPVNDAADVVIDKTTYSAGQAILQILDQHDIQSVTVVGIDTDVCVLQNAAYLFDAGIEVRVDTQACATNGGPEAEKAAYNLLSRTVGRSFVL